MLKRLFFDHPASVGETYLEHLAAAWSFAFQLLAAGLACLLHGVFPFAFKKTGSEAIKRLHHRMVSHRDRRFAGPVHSPGE